MSEGADDGLRQNRNTDACRNKNQEGLGIGGACIDFRDEAGLGIFVRNYVAVGFGGRIVIVLRQQEWLMTKIIAADRGKLRIGMAWGQNSIESVTPDYSGRITIDFRVPINDIENNIKAVQIQIHHQIQEIHI